MLSALSDPTRRAILDALRGREACVAEIAAPLNVSRPAVSQHLRVLSEAGLLTMRRSGTRHVYRLAPGGVHELRCWLDAMWDEALDSFAEEAEARAAQGTQAQHTPPSEANPAVPQPHDPSKP